MGETINAVILDADTLGPDDLDLNALFALPVNWSVYPQTSPEQVGERIADSQIVLTNKAPVNALSLSVAPGLKMISVLATGTDVIDLRASAERGVAVCNAVKYGTGSVVQHIWALILSLTTKLADYQRVAADGTWQKNFFFCLLGFPVEELQGKVLGIASDNVGVGRVDAGALDALIPALLGERLAKHVTVLGAAHHATRHYALSRCPSRLVTCSASEGLGLFLF